MLDADLACQTFLTLRAMAQKNNDNQVVGIIDSWAAGCTERADVAERLRIGTRRYDQAYKRLVRLADKLPGVLELEQGARDAR